MGKFLENCKWYGIAAAVGGIIVMVMFIPNLIAVNKPAQDFYSLAPSDVKGAMHISADVDFVMDCVTSKVTENKVAGIKTSEHENNRTYAVPFMYQDDKGYIQIDGIMGMQANNSSDYGKIERIIDASWAWWDDATGTVPYPTESFKVDGITRKMNKQEKELYLEYLVYCGYTQSEAEQMLVPYVVYNESNSRIFGMLGVGLLLVVVGAAAAIAGFILGRR